MTKLRNTKSSASNGGKWDGLVVRYAEWVIRWCWAVLAFLSSQRWRLCPVLRG